MKQIMGALVIIVAVLVLLSRAASMTPEALVNHIADDLVCMVEIR